MSQSQLGGYEAGEKRENKGIVRVGGQGHWNELKDLLRCAQPWLTKHRYTPPSIIHRLSWCRHGTTHLRLSESPQHYRYAMAFMLLAITQHTIFARSQHSEH
jgi:hypothetical protein